MDVMKEIKAIHKDAFTWISKHNPKQWCRGFFTFTSKCDSVDNNMCECFNATIIDARYRPIIDMFEEIRSGVKDRMERRRKIMEKWDGEFCPRIIDRLEKNIADQRGFCTDNTGNLVYEVRMNLKGYVVDLRKKSYTCRMWQLS